jgi:hypothetical protein
MSDDPAEADAGRIFVVGYTPEDAPIKSHTQQIDLCHHIAEETDIDIVGGFSTRDREVFERLRAHVDGQFPAFVSGDGGEA